MEGHQQDSQSDMRNEQNKKHIKKRTYNRVLTDAIINELKRLSGVEANSGASQYNDENFAEACISHMILLHQNQIPHHIFFCFPKLKNEISKNEYLKTRYKHDQEIYQNISSNNSKMLMIKQRQETRNYFPKHGNVELYETYGGGGKITIFRKIMYETLHQPQLTEVSAPQNNVASKIFIMPVELANLRKLLNPEAKYGSTFKYTKDLSLGQDTRFKPFQIVHTPDIKEPGIVGPNLTVQKKFARFDLKVCNVNIFCTNILQALQTYFFENPPDFTEKCEKRNNVPSLNMRYWHFRNIIQGYLLGILLKNINITSLNMTRKLYFVIITSFTSNLIITIKLKSSIFMVYDNSSYKDVPSWGSCSRVFINKTTSMAALENLLQARLFDTKNREKQLKMAEFVQMQECYPDISKSEDNLIETESNCDCNIIFSDVESLYSKASNSTILLQKSQSSAILLSLDVTSDEEVHATEVETNAHDTVIINNIFKANQIIYNSNFLHSKQWLTKIFPTDTENHKEKFQLKNIVDMFTFNSMKENILDRTSIHIRRLESLTDLYWKQVSSQSFYMLFLKSLGQSMANIFFSTVI